MGKDEELWAEEGIMKLERVEEPMMERGRKRGRREPESQGRKMEGSNLDLGRKQSIEELSNNRIRKQ